MAIDSNLLLLGAIWYVVFVVSTSIHEASHALVAWKLGDPTAYRGGQVTIHPGPHIRREPVGMVLVPIVSFLLNHWMIGWASAPYDPRWANRYPRRAAIMALAGPASNLLLVVLAGVLIRSGMAAGLFESRAPGGFFTDLVVPASSSAFAAGLARVLSILFSLNLILCMFNLLPLPPLDGSGALPLILPRRIAQRYQEILSEPMFALIGIVIAWKVFSELDIIRDGLHFSVALLYPEAF